MPKPQSLLPATYPAFLEEVKARIHAARLRAALAVNRELMLLYWSIGRDILAKQNEEGWEPRSWNGWGATSRRRFPA